MSCKYSPLGYIMLDCDKIDCYSEICNASKSEYKICVRYQQLENGIKLTPKQIENLTWLNENGYANTLTQKQIELVDKIEGKMVVIPKLFKKVKSESDCNSISCRECLTMATILFSPSCSWDCFNMKKAREFRVQISLK